MNFAHLIDNIRKKVSANQQSADVGFIFSIRKLRETERGAFTR